MLNNILKHTGNKCWRCITKIPRKAGGTACAVDEIHCMRYTSIKFSRINVDSWSDVIRRHSYIDNLCISATLILCNQHQIKSIYNSSVIGITECAIGVCGVSDSISKIPIIFIGIA